VFHNFQSFVGLAEASQFDGGLAKLFGEKIRIVADGEMETLPSHRLI